MHDVVDHAVPFTQDSKGKLDDVIAQLVSLYAKCVTHGDTSAALSQLKLHLRENIAWERNTVWRQMIAQQRRGAGQLEDVTGAPVVVAFEETGLVHIPTPLGQLRLTLKNIYFLVALLVFAALLNLDVIDGPEANKCFAILVFSTFLWASEVASICSCSPCSGLTASRLYLFS